MTVPHESLCLSHSHLEEFPRTNLSCVKIYDNDIPNDSITIKLTTTFRFIDIAFKLATVTTSKPRVMSRFMILKNIAKIEGPHTPFPTTLPRSRKEVPKETVQDQTTDRSSSSRTSAVAAAVHPSQLATI